MSAVFTVKYRIILLVVSITVVLTGVNIYILRSYQTPLHQYDVMLNNITMANNLLIVTREIVEKDFYSTLSNLNDKHQQNLFTNKLRSLEEKIKVLNSHLITDEEATDLQMIDRMMDSFIQVCTNILDENTPMKVKLANYEKAATIHHLLSKNMGNFISLQIQNRNRIAEELKDTTRNLWVFSILILGTILFICLLWGMFFANKIAESIYQEISHQKKAEKNAKHQANHDTLTRLPNRRLLEKFANTLIQTKPDLKMAVLFIDLDEFKPVNDRYGHDIGDKLLVYLAGIFTKCVRVEDMVCRFGGDEFVIIITQSNRKMIEQIVNRILSEISVPVVIDNLSLSITVSIGVSCYPDSAEKLDDLIVLADRAMYKAKERGKNNFAFTADINTAAPINRSDEIALSGQ